MASNPDIRGSLAAMKRAAAMACKIAMQTDTGIVIVKDGSIVHVSAEQLRRESEQP